MITYTHISFRDVWPAITLTIGYILGRTRNWRWGRNEDGSRK